MSKVFLVSPPAHVLLLVWSVFVVVVTLAYSCNLRAFLVAIDYERAIDSGQDILDLDRKLYIPWGKTGILL